MTNMYKYMLQDSPVYLRGYFSEVELKFMITALIKHNRSGLVGFIAELVKMTNSTSRPNNSINTDFDPGTITSKLAAMPYNTLVDLYTRLNSFKEFPDSNYRLTERLREAGLM